MKSGLTTINPNAPRLSVAGPMRAVKNQPAARRSSAVASRRQTLAHPGEDSASNDRRKSVRSTFASSRRAADPREISSKKYQSECKRKLIEYLTSHGYSETPLSMKTLQSPNQQDFLAMLSFLWRQIDANHKWGDKPHEDIPRLFQQLKYPSVLNKSQLISVGVPHVWPHVLAAMRWLVDLLNYTEMVDEERAKNMAADEENNKIFFDYLCKAYRRFLMGEDSFPDLDEELAHSFKEKNRAELDQVDQLEKENRELREQIEAMKLAPDRVEALEKKKNEHLQDLAKFENYIQSLEGYEKDLKQMADSKKHELETRRQDIEHFTKEKEELEERVSNQELSAIDVDRMNMEKKKLQEDLEQLGKQKDQVNEKIWNEEMNVSKKIEEVEAVIRTCNDLASELKLIPVTARNANGQNFEIRLNIHGSTVQDIVSLDLKSTLKPHVQAMKEKYNQKFHATHREYLKMQLDVTRLEDCVLEKKDEKTSIKTRFDKAQQQYQQEKEKLNGRLRELNQATEQLFLEARKAHEASISSVERANASFSQIQKQYMDLEAECEKERNKLERFLIQVFEQVTSHKQHILENIFILREHCKRQLESDCNMP